MALMVAIRNLASTQAHGTEEMDRAMVQLLKYCAKHPDAVIW